MRIIPDLQYHITKWGIFLGPIILLFITFYFILQNSLARAITLTVMGCIAISLTLFCIMWWKSHKVIEMAQKRYKQDIQNATMDFNEIVDKTGKKIKRKFGGK